MMARVECMEAEGAKVVEVRMEEGGWEEMEEGGSGVME